jgi:hypothetical protein
MSAEYDGRQIVGIDLHRRRSVIVRMTETGERLGTVRIDNDPVALATEMAQAGECPQVVLEATYGWYWAVDVLQEAGADVHLAHPLGVKGFAYRRVKNDVRDAADLPGARRRSRTRWLVRTPTPRNGSGRRLTCCRPLGSACRSPAPGCSTASGCAGRAVAPTPVCSYAVRTTRSPRWAPRVSPSGPGGN